MIYPQNFEQKTGFDTIRNLLKINCLSTLGKELVDSMKFSTEFDIIVLQLHLTEEFSRLCREESDFPTSFYYDIRPALEKIKIEGTYMTTEELHSFKRSLEVIKSIIRFFELRTEKYPGLSALTGEVKIYPFVLDRMNQIINKFGVIKDSASAELQQIRSDLARKLSNVSKQMQAVLKSAQNEGWLDSDIKITIRDGKMLIPVPTAYKRRIKGFVHDESATGKTSFIEPIEIVDVNNEIKELEFAERREIIKILIQFANDIRPYIDSLSYSYHFLGLIDFIRAKALFGISTNSFLPKKILPKPEIYWKNAIHPLLYLSLKKENRQVVPLDIEITKNQRIILISGPNAGGKSVYLKTVGLLQYMLQCGLLLPVHEDSQMGIFDDLFIDIGDEQSIENDLSTYSSHLLNMKHFTENANEKSLILIDEFGTGTEPMAGAAIAESILEHLNTNKTNGVITTHYTNLKSFASSAEGIINAAMLFDSDRLQPLFIMKTGQPGSSFAFEIAGKIGLNDTVLKLAAQKIGQEHIDFDQHLKNIEQDRKTIENQKKRLAQLEQKLEKTIEDYNKEIDFAIKQRKNILNITKEQAEAILANTNKKIEHTIFEIRRNQAEKEATKKVRAELEQFKQEQLEKQKEELEKIEAKISKLKEKKVKQKKSKDINQPIPVIEKIIAKGDYVRLKKQNAVGEVLDIKGNKITVAFGDMQTSVDSERLEVLSRNEARELEKQTKSTLRSIGWDISKQTNNFLFGLDVRGKRTDEAIQRVTQYIDEAIVANAHEVKILHGTGNGILRQMIREYLTTIDVVQSVRDEHIQFGGSGITIVNLSY